MGFFHQTKTQRNLAARPGPLKRASDAGPGQQQLVPGRDRMGTTSVGAASTGWEFSLHIAAYNTPQPSSSGNPIRRPRAGALPGARFDGCLPANPPTTDK